VKEKTCTLCGERFSCGAGAPGCWCERIALSQDAFADIRRRADDCLCPSCLAAYEGYRSEG
jgi:hypothetical protein